MGRSDRIAPHICSTLELRTNTQASAMAPLPVLPSSTVALSKPPASSSSSSSSSSSFSSSCPPPSPDTPGQAPPACVKPQAWPQDVLQLMQQQVELLMRSSRSHNINNNNSNGGGGGGGDGSNEEQTGKRKRNCGRSEREEKPLEEKRWCKKKDAAAAVVGRVEVELHAQSPLPEEWEQFLDLKTGELYYFHWGSCKRAKSDPRELVQQADKAVQALVQKAQARFFTSPKDMETQESYYTAAAATGAPEDLIPSSECLHASSSQASPPEEVEESAWSEEERLRTCGDDDDDDDEEEEESSSNCESKGMVALSCKHCSMFVLLSLSSPLCPSCGGEYLQAVEDHDRDG